MKRNNNEIENEQQQLLSLEVYQQPLESALSFLERQLLSRLLQLPFFHVPSRVFHCLRSQEICPPTPGRDAGIRQRIPSARK